MFNEQKKFLEEQLDWVKSQRVLCDKIASKLREMKAIAEEASQETLTDRERRQLQGQFEELKGEVEHLYKRMEQVLH